MSVRAQWCLSLVLYWSKHFKKTAPSMHTKLFTLVPVRIQALLCIRTMSLFSCNTSLVSMISLVSASSWYRGRGGETSICCNVFKCDLTHLKNTFKTLLLRFYYFNIPCIILCTVVVTNMYYVLYMSIYLRIYISLPFIHGNLYPSNLDTITKRTAP